MSPFCAQNLKTNYNVVPFGNHGTERLTLVSFIDETDNAIIVWFHSTLGTMLTYQGIDYADKWDILTLSFISGLNLWLKDLISLKNNM